MVEVESGADGRSFVLDWEENVAPREAHGLGRAVAAGLGLLLGVVDLRPRQLVLQPPVVADALPGEHLSLSWSDLRVPQVPFSERQSDLSILYYT